MLEQEIMPEKIKVTKVQSWEHLQAIMEKDARKTNKWQHEDTGRLVDMPVGENPGRRWYRVPEDA